MVHKRLTFNLHSITTDSKGQYVIISSTIYDTKLTIINIYRDDPSFFHLIFIYILYISYIFIHIEWIIKYYNWWRRLTVLNPKIFCSKGNHKNIIKQYMNDFGLGNSWRLSNPTLREYSYFSPYTNHFRNRLHPYKQYINDICNRYYNTPNYNYWPGNCISNTKNRTGHKIFS